MSKKHFIELADRLRHISEHVTPNGEYVRLDHVISELEEFCARQNPQFNRRRWLAYIAGECGPSGGAVKTA